MSVEVTTAGAIAGLVSSSLTASSGHLSGDDFVEMVKQTPYYVRLDVPSVYEVYIQTAKLHRLLLVKEKGSTLPLITFEIIAPDLRTLKPLMRKFSQNHLGTEKVGDHKGTLLSLCEIANKVVHKMGNYRLFTNNCQHFCNNLLQEIRFETLKFKTTIGPNVSINKPNGEKDIGGFIPHKVNSAYRSALSCTPSSVGKAAAVAVGYAIGAPIPATGDRNDT